MVKKPNADSKVTIAYKGTMLVITYEDDKSKLKDVKEAKLIGNTFDSSYSATFSLRNLIECWKDTIPKVSNGSTIILYCSPDKAYGTRAPAVIGPNQTLSFEITLKDKKFFIKINSSFLLLDHIIKSLLACILNLAKNLFAV